MVAKLGAEMEYMQQLRYVGMLKRIHVSVGIIATIALQLLPETGQQLCIGVFGLGLTHLSFFRAISIRSSMPVHWLKTMTLSPATADWPTVPIDAAGAALLDPPKRAASRALDLLRADRTPELCLSFSALQSGIHAQASTADQLQQCLWAYGSQNETLHQASSCWRHRMTEARF